uniref:Uncharacterized protein n=1 Tax=Pyrodinium bahamense TaxID=73915 RepID=A0A7S0B7J5_9DINO
MARGAQNGYRHGERIDGRCFFGGAKPGPWGWGQTHGINAGVMLLKPDLDIMDLSLAEVADPSHPEHIRGCGPEQDYLSRFYASEWSHIDVAYNFQLHQMYFILEYAGDLKKTDRARFLLDSERIKVFHYSSDPKPWARWLDPRFAAGSEEEWLRFVQSSFAGFRAWVMRDPEWVTHEGAFNGVCLGLDGQFYRAWGSTSQPGSGEGAEWGEPPSPAAGQDVEGSAAAPPGEVVEIPAWAIDATEAVTKLALRSWDQAYQELAANLAHPHLADAVVAAVSGQRLPVVEASLRDVDQREVVFTGQPAPPASSEDANRWTWHCGWWCERPWVGRLVVVSSYVPCPHAVLSLDGRALMAPSREGVHVAAASAVADCPPPRTFADGPGDWQEAVRWAQAVPEGAAVLIAIVGQPADGVLASLTTGGLGGPLYSEWLPTGCYVAAAVGTKGQSYWPDTHAAPDVAWASCSKALY